LKCTDVRRIEAVGNLNEVKPNEGLVKCIWEKFKCEEPK